MNKGRGGGGGGTKQNKSVSSREFVNSVLISDQFLDPVLTPFLVRMGRSLGIDNLHEQGCCLEEYEVGLVFLSAYDCA